MKFKNDACNVQDKNIQSVLEQLEKVDHIPSSENNLKSV